MVFLSGWPPHRMCQLQIGDTTVAVVRDGNRAIIDVSERWKLQRRSDVSISLHALLDTMRIRLGAGAPFCASEGNVLGRRWAVDDYVVVVTGRTEPAFVGIGYSLAPQSPAPGCDSLLADQQLPPGQRSALEALTRTHPGWRLAELTDNSTVPELKRAHVPVPAQPYFARERESGEGSFAVALVRSDTFSVFYERWDGTTYRPATFVTQTTWLNEGGLFLHGDTLRVAPLSSDAIFEFVWDPEHRVMKLTGSPGG